MTVEKWIELRRYPGSQVNAVRAITITVRRRPNGELQMSFRLDADIERLRLPAPCEPRFAANLWQHTCLEAFIAIDGQPAYHEFNFAPSGQWAVFAFRGYRDGGPLADETMRPRIDVRVARSRLELDALVRLDRISPEHPRARLRLGLSAVIEASDGLTYWALRHPAARADFHNPEGFALLLEPPGPEML